jgi:hypothetical protein
MPDHYPHNSGLSFLFYQDLLLTANPKALDLIGCRDLLSYHAIRNTFVNFTRQVARRFSADMSSSEPAKSLAPP